MIPFPNAANGDKFMWFPHMWNHIQPHLYSNSSQLIVDMMKNKDFAKVSLASPSKLQDNA